jgi:hypothetical protein
MAEPKATKKDFLEFIRKRETITAYDLMDEFGYSYSYACKKLSLLKRQGLVQDIGDTPLTYRGQWCLTEKGHEKLRFLRQREEEQDAVVQQEEMLDREETIRLKKRVEELEELVKIITGPGGLKGEVTRLLKECEELRATYAQALKLGAKPEQLDLKDLTSRLEKLQKYSELLPPEEREKLLITLGQLR